MTTLKEKAYATLKEKIIQGELASGSVLTERTLVEMLEMSRTPIRAALERLDADGLAKYTPNKGLIVSEISLQRAVEVYDARMALEGFLAYKLAQHGWPEADRRPFLDNLAEQRDAVAARDAKRFTIADAVFHRALAVRYGNREMLAMLDRLQDMVRLTALNVLHKDDQRIHVSLQDHEAIFEAICNKDGVQAQQRMVEHLEFGKRILIL